MCCFLELKAQNITQNVIASSCNSFSNGNIVLSSILGETFSQTLNGSNYVNQGFHQSFDIDSGVIISNKIFIQSLYMGNGKMRNMLSIPNLSSNTTDVVMIELHNSNFPYEKKYEQSSILSTDGIVKTVFPISVIGNSFFVVIRHRNSIETWSDYPILFNMNNNFYDFSSSQTNAFGDNLVFMDNGIYAIYSGDINQDGFIDGNDFVQIDNENAKFLNGFLNTDLNGDGFVDGNDFIQIDNNNSNFIGAIVP